MPDQSLLLLEVLERILTNIQLLFRSKGLRIWGVVPGVNVIPSKLHHLQQSSSQVTSARISPFELTRTYPLKYLPLCSLL